RRVRRLRVDLDGHARLGVLVAYRVDGVQADEVRSGYQGGEVAGVVTALLVAVVDAVSQRTARRRTDTTVVVESTHADGRRRRVPAVRADDTTRHGDGRVGRCVIDADGGRRPR